MKTKLIAALTCTFLLSGCHSYKDSLGTYAIPAYDIKSGTKSGKVCSDENWDPFDSKVDLTVETARKRGGIKEITNIEREINGVFLFYTTCVKVTGN